MGVDELVDEGAGGPRDARRRDPLDELRRRERQQSFVAELGRSALTGTPLERLVEEAVEAAAEGLGADRVGLLEPVEDGSVLFCRSSRGWPADQLRPVPVDADSQVAETFRTQDPIVVDDFAHEAAFPDSRHLATLGLASGATTAVRGEGRPIGVLAAHSVQLNAFTTDDVVFLRAIANVIAVVTARERAEERRRRSEADLEFLAEAGHILAATLEYDTTLANLASLVVPRLADWFIVDLAEEDGTIRRVVVAAARPEKQALLDELSRSYPPTAPSPQPAGIALERGETVHFPAFSEESLRATTRDERHHELMSALDPRSAIAAPLIARGRTLGALTLAWSESGHRYEDVDIPLVEELARRAALAIDNARLYGAAQAARNAAEDAQRRVGFVADASTTLAQSLEYTETLGSLARLAVPRLADWCLVYAVSTDGKIERLAVEHAGGSQERLKAILAKHAIDPDALVGVPNVIRTGQSELHADATPEEVTRDVEEPGTLAAELADINVTSTMCVPLVARARTIGAILFIAAESQRHYAEDDLRLAEELAARAALALDNSRLYREAEERAEAARALATIADGVFLVDRNGIIRIWNAAAAAITGMSAADVRGRPAREVLPDWDRIAAMIPTGPPGRQAPAAPNTIPLALEGRELWLSISGVGSAEGAVYAFRDVTQEQRLDRIKSEFVATVSHELRTPLAAVYGAAVTLAQRDLSGREEVREALVAQIAEQAERLATIVEDILLTGEIEAGRLRLERRNVDPVEVARAAVEAARPRLGQGAALELREGDVGSIETDAGRLRQVLDNLIENAIKYSPHVSQTEVRFDADERSVRIVVTDKGVGIPVEEHDRIFEKFYRLDPEQARGVGGTGLGLYVCRELVERMAGRISVDSAPGLGSTFTVELPRQPDLA